MTIMSIYKQVRTSSPLGDYRYNSFVGHFISSQISPFITKLCIKKGIIPNKITVMMILSGIAGALLFATNNIYLQILSVFFINLWFIFDCSDGEVARITKKFSTFGKEIDYIAHVVNHPLLLISYSFVLYINTNNVYFIIPLILICILDLMYRNILTLQQIENLKVNNKNIGVKARVSFIRYVLMNFLITPNFVIFYPLIYVFDNIFGSDVSFYYSLITMIIMLFFIPRIIIQTTIRLYKAN